jgi:hypothetical protein
MITTQASRLALATAALCALLAGAPPPADAKPRRVVVLDFDGPRALADRSRTAVANLLGEQYDVVSIKRWEDARAQVKDTRGPQGWRKAAKQSGVDAVIEGWIQDEGRHKLLYVLVRDASTGDEVDKLAIRLAKHGVSESGSVKLRAQLDEVLEYVEAMPEIASKLPPVTAREASEIVGARRRLEGDAREDRGAARDAAPDRQAQRGRRAEAASRDGEGAERAPTDEAERRSDAPRADASAPDTGREDREAPKDREGREDGEGRADREDAGVTERATPRAGTDVAAVEQNEAISIFGPTAVEAEVYAGKSPARAPRPTPRFAVFGGAYYGARSFVPEADDVDAQDFGARSKGFVVGAQVYPAPRQKLDGALSGVGLSFQLYRSAGGVVGADTDETVGNYGLTQQGFEGAIHYRLPLGLVSIDGEAGYSQHSYVLASDFPLDVPDTQYSGLHGGAHLDLHITERAQVGVGAKLYYVFGQGDASDVDGWYGPGQSSGLQLDASFVVPLPKSLFVRGELAYRRIKTELDGVGDLTEDLGALGYADATMNGSVTVGVQF